jgi:diguanylate cyclase (GGDEF)-like protein
MSRSRVGQLCLIAILYFVADIVLNTFILGKDGWEIFWPLNGITIAVLLMRPRGEWPLFLLTMTVSSACAELLCGTALSLVVLYSFAAILEIVLAALLLPPFRDLETWMREPRLYPRFSLAVLGPPLLAAAFAAAGIVVIQGTSFLAAMLEASSEVLGVSAMVPLVLSLHSVSAQALRNLQWWGRVFVVLCATVVVMMIMFLGDQFPLLFLLYPFLMWVETVLGLFGSSIALACACVLSAVLTQQGYGPFAHTFAAGMARNLSVELYLAFHLVCFLPVSIMSMERQRLTRELRAALMRATALATVDSLTGISNRRTFESRFAEQWELAARNRGSLAILMIDVDYFKRFNDGLGHQAGDECLRAVARALESQVSRPTDLVARFGGEEFVVLLPDTSLKGASRVAEGVRAAIQELGIEHADTPIENAAGPPCVTVSVGCAAITPEHNSRAQDLIARADEALYLAKRTGRNRVCSAANVYGPKPLREKLRDRIGTLGSTSGFTGPKS